MKKRKKKKRKRKIEEEIRNRNSLMIFTFFPFSTLNQHRIANKWVALNLLTVAHVVVMKTSNKQPDRKVQQTFYEKGSQGLGG